MQKLTLTTYADCMQVAFDVTLQVLDFPSVPVSLQHSLISPLAKAWPEWA